MPKSEDTDHGTAARPGGCRQSELERARTRDCNTARDALEALGAGEGEERACGGTVRSGR